MTGVELIAAERTRQTAVEGYTFEHDDHHDGGELALVAALYATPVILYEKKERTDGVTFRDPWPWAPACDPRPRSNRHLLLPNWCNTSPVTWKRSQRINQLAKAGALVAAEIDRLLREEQRNV